MNGGTSESGTRRDDAAPLREPPSGAAPGYRRIWSLAWPVSVSTSTVTLFQLVNLYWVGHLGTVAVAAVSLSAHVLFIVFGISQIIYGGTLAIVARRFGGRDLDAAFVAGAHGVLLGAAAGIAVAAVGYATSPAIVGFFDAGPEMEAIATSYLRIMFGAQGFLFTSMALAACYQACGDTRTPMLVNGSVVVLHMLLDPFLIFPEDGVVVAGVSLGWLGWGVDGAAIAGVIAAAAGAVFLVSWSWMRAQPLPRPRGRLVLATQELAHIARIGIPAGLSFIARPLSTFVLLKIIATFGTAAIAAFGIAFRSFNVNWIPYSGLNVAISSLVGQSLGAKDVAEAERVVGRGLVITAVLGVCFCFFYYFLAEEIIRAFDDDPFVVSAGASFLQLIALSFLFSAPMFSLVAAMNGAGDTRPPMVVAFLANWVVKLPLAYFLALPAGYGIDGVWIGIFVSIIFEAIAMSLWYRRGTWKAKRV